jgi:hypothetical protein
MEPTDQMKFDLEASIRRRFETLGVRYLPHRSKIGYLVIGGDAYVSSGSVLAFHFDELMESPRAISRMVQHEWGRKPKRVSENIWTVQKA